LTYTQTHCFLSLGLHLYAQALHAEKGPQLTNTQKHCHNNPGCQTTWPKHAAVLKTSPELSSFQRTDVWVAHAIGATSDLLLRVGCPTPSSVRTCCSVYPGAQMVCLICLPQNLPKISGASDRVQLIQLTHAV